MRFLFTATTIVLSALIIFGLIWFFFLGSGTPVGFGWYLFSFATGLTMIVLPCTLPLAFVIVPLSMGKGAAKGLGIAIAFGLGVAITLSFYGVLAAVVGEVAIGTLGAPLETVKNWLYFVAGVFAYLFALGEIGLVRYRMPTYTGAAPAFIQRRQDYLKALLLGLFLGNIGVGCPHPATPVILTRIAASGDVFYGWMLFFTHAVGRILPLLLLALLGILGVNALTWLVARKEKIERATGWGMVFVAGFILVLGLFTHDWWVYSGQHTLFEEVTQEERVVGVVAQKLGVEPPHAHGIPTGTGLLGLPLWLGNWVLVALFILPLWWHYRKKRKSFAALPEEEKKIETRAIPLRFGLYLTLSLLFALTFIWVLPDRFLNHTLHPGEEPMHEEAAHAVLSHEETAVREGLVVNLNVTPVPVHAAEATRLDFFVNEKPVARPVPASDLEIAHTKLMHVIGVRNDMNEFRHIHPAPTDAPGILSAADTFAKPGLYKFWSEIRVNGADHVFGHPEFAVQGPRPAFERQVSFGRNAVVGLYQVSLELEEPVAKGHPHELAFDIHTVTGDEVAVEPYLAADMHLTIIRDDWKQFIHTHPTEEEGEHHGAVRLVTEALANGRDIPGAVHDATGEDEKIRFRVVFPEAGLYKLFAQFRPRGIDVPPDEALLASFWIRAEESAPAAIPDKVLYTAVSLILIALLSWGTKKYLTSST